MNAFERAGLAPVINAAGKLSSLGGTAQARAVADAQAAAAMAHVDLADLRRAAGERIARVTGAEAACVTSGAASGIAIAVAAVLTGTDLGRVRRVPNLDGPRDILLQRGHDVDFGAEVTQMIRLGGGRPVVFGSLERVTEADLAAALSPDTAAIVYVQSHHCVQEGRLALSTLLDRDVPVLVDAAAESDLRVWIDAGADVVTYSGGKAIGGPTCGFVAGNQTLIEACEAQQRGIARAMKVGKEQIMGLLAALDRAVVEGHADEVLEGLRAGLAACADVTVVPDGAGRPIRRVALQLPPARLRALVQFLHDGDPSIRTRNHELDKGRVQFDPRELRPEHVPIIVGRVRQFFFEHAC